jgi:hypothetical protein
MASRHGTILHMYIVRHITHEMTTQFKKLHHYQKCYYGGILITPGYYLIIQIMQNEDTLMYADDIKIIQLYIVVFTDT